MSIAEQRSLIRGLNMSGLLPQLEKVTLGDGTTSYVRSPGRGPGRDLYTVRFLRPILTQGIVELCRGENGGIEGERFAQEISDEMLV